MRLAQMERMARRLEFKDHLARHDHDNPSLADDFAFLTGMHGPWKPWLARLRREGPTAVGGGLMGVVAPNPPSTSLTTVTGTATEQALVPIVRTPIDADARSGQLYFFWLGGTATTAATPGTFTFTPRIGPAPTNASTGILGATTANFTPPTSSTATQWGMTGFLLTRGGGTAANASASFEFSMAASLTGGGPLLATASGQFGGITAATYDGTGGTVALWMGVTHATSTTNTWVPQEFAWASLN